jgi:hypothetical protein
MSFAQNVTTNNIELSFYLWIEGVPRVFTNVANTFSYGDYTESKTFIRPQNIELPMQKLENWGGLQVASSLSFELVFDSFWRTFANKNKNYGGVCRLTGDIDASDTTIEVDDTTVFASSGYIYIGKETIAYSGKTSTSFTGCTRAALGSIAAPHYATFQDNELGSGTWVADRPLSLNGRRIQLWASPKFGSANYASTIFSGEDKLLYSGFVTNSTIEYSAKKVVIESSDINSIWEKTICNYVPSAELIPIGMVAIDNYTKYADFFIDGISSDDRINCTINGLAYASTSDTWQEGVITLEALKNQINQWIMASGHADAQYFRLDQIYLNSEKKVYLKFAMNNYATVTRGYSMVLYVDGDTRTRRSLWKELGFTSNKDGTRSVDGGIAYFEYVADEARPRFRYSTDILTNESDELAYRPIWLRCRDSNFYTESDFKTQDETIQKNYFRINDNIFEWDESVSSGLYRRFNITAIECFNSFFKESSISLGNEDDIEIKRGFGVRSMEWPRAILYAVCSGQDATGYESGYKGLGAAQSVTLFDTASFALAAKNSFAALYKAAFYYEEKTKLRDIIEPILAVCQYYINFENGKFYLKPIQAVFEDSTASYGSGEILSIDTEYDNSEENIINKLVFEDRGQNQATESDGASASVFDGVSVGTFGIKQEKNISLRWLEGALDNTIHRNIATRFFALWASPFMLINISVNANSALTHEIGDVIDITSDYILNPLTLEDGVTALKGRIYGLQFLTNAVAKITIVVDSIDGIRKGQYSPAMRINWCDDNYTGVVYDHEFSTSDAAKDGTHFSVGDKVYLYEQGNEAAASVVTTIIAKDYRDNEYYFEFQHAVYHLTKPIVIAQAHNTVVDAQKTKVFIGAKTTRPIILGDEEPWYYN